MKGTRTTAKSFEPGAVAMMVAAALALAGCGGAEQAKAPPAETKADPAAQVRALLDAADAGQTGYARDAAQPDQVKPLGKEERLVETLSLQPGTAYRIVGRCGAGCEEIGLAASRAGPSGSGQESLGATDDGVAPGNLALDITAPADGRARVTLTLWECSAQPCTVGWRVYKATGAAPARP